MKEKHGRAEEYIDTKLQERDSRVKMKSEIKKSKIENVIDTANEILERKKQMGLESFESKINKANKL